MTGLPSKKVGLISCSGEGLACGTLSRVAVRYVLDVLRHGDTVALCLPLLLSGSEQERGFARANPTISVDGCSKQCAKKATEKYSAKVADEIVVDVLLEKQGLEVKPEWRHVPGQDGMKAAYLVAECVAGKVDGILHLKNSGAVATSDHPSAGLIIESGITIAE